MSKEDIIEELAESPDLIFIITDTLTAPSGVVTVESFAYMTKVNKNNKWGLKTFKDDAGSGYIIEKKTTKNDKPMKWKGQKKSTNVEDRRTAKPGRKKITLNNVATAAEKKKAAAKKKKPTGLNGAASKKNYSRRVLNTRNLSKIDKTGEFKITASNSENFALASWAFDEFVITVNKKWKNRWSERTFVRRTKLGTVNLIKKELKNLVGY